eukprot:15364425-Ditylum_brightwellii.AAC.2
MGPFLDTIEAEGNQLFGETTIGENGYAAELSGDTNTEIVVEEYHGNKLVIDQLKERILNDKKRQGIYYVMSKKFLDKIKITDTCQEKAR